VPEWPILPIFDAPYAATVAYITFTDFHPARRGAAFCASQSKNLLFAPSGADPVQQSTELIGNR
jgi:hypothetical protein